MDKLNIKTARDLRDKEPTIIKKKFNVVAERIVRELRGTQCIELDDIAQDRKNAACTRSFGQPLTDLADIRKAMSNGRYPSGIIQYVEQENGTKNDEKDIERDEHSLEDRCQQILYLYTPKEVGNQKGQEECQRHRSPGAPTKAHQQDSTN